MRRAWLTITVGALLLIAGVAGRVIVPEHKPVDTSGGASLSESVNPFTTSGGPSGAGSLWSQSLYDALRIATWAVLIVGLIMVIVGLINYARRATPA